MLTIQILLSHFFNLKICTIRSFINDLLISVFSSWCMSPVFLFPGVKFVPWPSSPSPTCKFTPKRTQRRKPTSVLTAPRRLRTPRTWPSICASTWASSRTAAPTVRDASASSPTCSSTQGLTSDKHTAHLQQFRLELHKIANINTCNVAITKDCFMQYLLVYYMP